MKGLKGDWGIPSKRSIADTKWLANAELAKPLKCMVNWRQTVCHVLKEVGFNERR